MKTTPDGFGTFVCEGEKDEEATAAAIYAQFALLGLDELPSSEACRPPLWCPARYLYPVCRPVGPTRTCALLLVAQAAIDEAFQAGAEAIGQHLSEGKLGPGDQRLAVEILRSTFDACAVLKKAVAD